LIVIGFLAGGGSREKVVNFVPYVGGKGAAKVVEMRVTSEGGDEDVVGAARIVDRGELSEDVSHERRNVTVEEDIEEVFLALIGEEVLSPVGFLGAEVGITTKEMSVKQVHAVSGKREG